RVADNLCGVGYIIRRPLRSRRRFSGDQRVVLAGGGLFLRERIHAAIRAYKQSDPGGSPNLRRHSARPVKPISVIVLAEQLAVVPFYTWASVEFLRRRGNDPGRAENFDAYLHTFPA